MLTFFVLRTCVAAMTLKKPKTHLKFSKAFNIRKLRGTVVKSNFLKKKYAFYEHGFRSGGMFLFINMLQAVRIRILLAMVILVSSTHFPQKISATLGSLGDPENPEMKKFSV